MFECAFLFYFLVIKRREGDSFTSILNKINKKKFIFQDVVCICLILSHDEHIVYKILQHDGTFLIMSCFFSPNTLSLPPLPPTTPPKQEHKFNQNVFYMVE